MITATSPTNLALSAVALSASGGFLLATLRHRGRPAARPFVGIAVALVLGAAVHLAVVDLAPVRSLLDLPGDPTAVEGGVWVLVAYDLAAVVAALWFLFALRYTGRGGRTATVAYGAVALLSVALAAATVSLVGGWARGAAGAPDRNAVVGFATLLSEGLALIGAFLVGHATLRHRAFPAGRTATLVGGVAVVLAVPFAATTLRTPATTPLAVATASALFAVAVGRYGVFETLPVATVAGRDRVIDELSEGVVVVDGEGVVRDLNPRAERLFDAGPSGALGRPVGRVAPALPDPAAVVADGPADVRTADGRVLSVTADPVTDAHGRAFGHLFVCRDVTDERARERRLTVLTRLVAGVTRDRMTAVAETADGVAAGEDDPAAAADRVWTASTDLASLVARVRDVERALADRTATDPGAADDPADATAVVEALPDRAGDADAVAVSVPDERLPVAVDRRLLAATLETLVAGAGRGTDGPVEVSAHLTDGGDEAPVAVTVASRAGDESGDDAVAALSRRVARLVGDYTAVTVAVGDDGTTTLRVPTADRPVGAGEPEGPDEGDGEGPV